MGHEDSDSENLDEIVKPLLPVNSVALEPPVTAEPLVPVSKLVEVEKKFEDLSRRLKVNSIFTNTMFLIMIFSVGLNFFLKSQHQLFL